MMNGESKINIGIIGPGRVAERHASAIAQIDGAQLWSIAGRNIESAKEFTKAHHCHAINSIFDDVEKMLLDPKLDAVIIATPDKLHTRHILLAIEASKSILVEKPLCTSIPECDQISQAYRNGNAVLAVGYHLRWHDGLRQLANQCREKRFGQPIHLRMHWGVDFLSHQKWRTNSEYSKWFCLTVLGTHLIDIMRWLMVPLCGELLQIKSIIGNYHLNSVFDETVMALFEFESGATAEIYCSITHDSPFKLEVYASDATVVCYDLAGDSRKIIINDTELAFLKNNPYVPQIENFVRAIKEHVAPEVNLGDAFRNVKTMLSISNCGKQDV